MPESTGGWWHLNWGERGVVMAGAEGVFNAIRSVPAIIMSRPPLSSLHWLYPNIRWERECHRTVLDKQFCSFKNKQVHCDKICIVTIRPSVSPRSSCKLWKFDSLSLNKILIILKWWCHRHYNHISCLSLSFSSDWLWAARGWSLRTRCQSYRWPEVKRKHDWIWICFGHFFQNVNFMPKEAQICSVTSHWAHTGWINVVSMSFQLN